MWWPGTELNRRRQPFQGCALPPELPGHVLSLHCRQLRVFGYIKSELPVIAGNRNAGSGGTAPIITTKLDSLNAPPLQIQIEMFHAIYRGFTSIAESIIYRPVLSHSPTALP
jgi:hypothetical protein